ncbi:MULTISPECIES: CaiB/BaiF CoA transferase family protein [unclassified Cupriavidus]|uniref:CaiB/BaiF CoA transferase family protein n=1 Tax=Cupriavidus sp. H19C3 TaxID=3241603 RepID=UPI0011D7BC62|nr:MAG: CoA transferase [Cupriavidus sp.]
MFKSLALTPDAKGPLDGIRILDLSRLVAGNTLTMALADLGADVLKVEPPGGDTLRDWKVRDVATAWKAYSRNKRSLCLNFRATGAIAVILDLVRHADVLIESFKPGTLEAMGLGTEVLHAHNRKLVIVRVSGWGQDGPYSHRPGFGTLVEGMSGFASMNGFDDREPVLPPIYLGDMTAGLYGAVGVLSAVRHVEVQGGAGQVIDLPLLDPTFAILGAQAANYRLTGKVKPRTGSRSTNSAPRNAYQTADGKWVCLSASTQAMAERLFRVIGRADLIADPRFATNAGRVRHAALLDGIIGEFLGKMTQDACVDFFDKAGVTIGPIYDMSDIERDPHFQARDIVVELPDAEMGRIPVHNISPRLSGTPGAFRRVAPQLGEHSAEALREAGYSDERIAALRAAGVIAEPREA